MELYSWEKHRPKWVNVTASHIWGLSYIPPRKFLANTIFQSMLLAFSMYSNPRKCWLDIPIIPHYIPYFFGSLPILQLYTTPFIAILYIYIQYIYIYIYPHSWYSHLYWLSGSFQLPAALLSSCSSALPVTSFAPSAAFASTRQRHSDQRWAVGESKASRRCFSPEFVRRMPLVDILTERNNLSNK